MFWAEKFSGNIVYWFGSPNTAALQKGVYNQTVNILIDNSGQAHVHIYPNQTDEKRNLSCLECKVITP